MNTALSRNTNIIRFGGFYGVPPVGSLGSSESFTIQCLHAMANTVLGSSVIGGDLLPPITEFLLEISDATIRAGISIEEMNHLIQNVISHMKLPPA